MKTHGLRLLPLCTFLVAFGVSAQPENKPAHEQRTQPVPRDIDWKTKDVRELVETVMMVRLSTELELDDEQTVLLVRRLDRARQDLMEKRKLRNQQFEAVQRALAAGDEAPRLEEALDTLLALDREIATFKQAKFDQLREGLSLEQAAKLYVFVDKFEEDMRTLIRRAQEHRLAPQSGPPMNRRASPDRPPLAPQPATEASGNAPEAGAISDSEHTP